MRGRERRRRRAWWLAGLLVLAGCSSTGTQGDVTVTLTTTVPLSTAASWSVPTAATSPSDSATYTSTSSQMAPTPATPPSNQATGSSSNQAEAAGTFTVAFAGDVNFALRTADRLAANPATAFGVAKDVLGQADFTMVNLETAITTGGDQQVKSYTFRAPPSALTALAEANIDLATMANNHAADYGLSGLQDTFAAIGQSPIPVVGVGENAAQAYAPFTTVINGVPVAILAASQVQDETLANFSADDTSPGIANAFSDRLIDGVRQAKAAGSVVIVYLHWGTEYETCPNDDQTELAERLAEAGAAAVIGTHAHVLQGAGWRSDGVYVAYGLSNYLWWMSFGNNQDDNGVLTLTFTGGKVVADNFEPAHLDDTGVPVPATDETRDRILADWAADRQCAGLAGKPAA